MPGKILLMQPLKNSTGIPDRVVTLHQKESTPLRLINANGCRLQPRRPGKLHAKAFVLYQMLKMRMGGLQNMRAGRSIQGNGILPPGIQRQRDLALCPGQGKANPPFPDQKRTPGEFINEPGQFVRRKLPI